MSMPSTTLTLTEITTRTGRTYWINAEGIAILEDADDLAYFEVCDEAEHAAAAAAEWGSSYVCGGGRPEDAMLAYRQYHMTDEDLVGATR